MHRLPLCLIPSSESNLSRACRLYWFNRWLTSIIRFPHALKQLPSPHCNGDLPHETGWGYNGNATLYGSSCT